MNDDPQPRSYKAVVVRSDNTGYKWESEPVTVTTQRTEFNPILVTGSYTVNVGGEVQLTGTVAKDIAGTGYWMRLVDGAGNVMKICTSGTVCTHSESVPWNQNSSPQSRTYRLRVSKSGSGSGYVFESPLITVDVLPVRFGVTLDATSELAQGPDGKRRWQLTATSDRAIAPAGYRIYIKDSGGTVAMCTTGTSCSGTGVAGQRYRAYVTNASGTVFGESFWLDLSNANGAEVHGDGYVDFVAAEGLWPTVDDFCIDVAAYGTHSNYTVSNEWLDTCALGGFGTVGEAIRGLVRTPEGRALLATLVAVYAVNEAYRSSVYSPSATPTPAPTPTPDPYTPPVDGPVASTDPPGLRYPELEQALIDRNRALLDYRLRGSGVAVASAVETLARECVSRMTLAQLSVELCESTPIFAPGADVNEATAWNRTALWAHPEWARLRYVAKGENDRWYYNHSESAGWVSNPAPSCRGSFNPADIPGSTACQEFPYWSTKEGGENVPLPFLKIINWSQNSAEGNSLGTFLGSSSFGCGLAAQPAASPQTNSGVPFLVLPTLAMPVTLWACNEL